MKTNRFVGLLAAAALSFGALSSAVSPVSAAPGDTAYPSAEPDGKAVFDADGRGISQRFTDIEPGTSVYTLMISCTGKNYAGTQSLPSTGPGAGVLHFSLSQSAGPLVRLYFRTSAPGRSDQKYGPSAGVSNPVPTSCPTGGGPSTGEPITSSHIKKWSTKKTGASRAEVGRRAKITKTYLTPAGGGMKVTYRWTVGGKVVDKDRSVKIKKSYAGRTLKARVTISKAGYTSRSKTLRFGKVKK